jgi:hypothetical protein
MRVSDSFPEATVTLRQFPNHYILQFQFDVPILEACSKIMELAAHAQAQGEQTAALTITPESATLIQIPKEVLHAT